MNETLKNLVKAFIGESQARNRYSFYAKIASKEGFEEIAELFLITADNEREHAKKLFELIQELKDDLNEVEVQTKAPVKYGTTINNLKAAIEGENYEHSIMYPSFAKTAREEGLPKIGARLMAISRAEEHHEERYKKLLAQLEAKTFFKKSEVKEWVCRKCGYVHKGTEPPMKCPSCDHEKKYFELKCEEY